MAAFDLVLAPDAFGSLSSDLSYLANAMRRIESGELSVPSETRDRALKFCGEVIERRADLIDELSIKTKPGVTPRAGKLVCDVELSPAFRELLAAIRACDVGGGHGDAPAVG